MVRPDICVLASYDGVIHGTQTCDITKPYGFIRYISISSFRNKSKEFGFFITCSVVNRSAYWAEFMNELQNWQLSRKHSYKEFRQVS